MSEFTGKTAIISGGAEGIGLSIAQALGAEKMNIVLADIDQTNLEKAGNDLAAAGIPVLTVALDVSQEEQWHEVANQAINMFGKIHMIVNNAGIGGDTGPIENQDQQGWQWALDVNLMGVVFGAKVMTPYIKSHGEGGWIVNVASMAGMGGIPYLGAYTATKAAVVALSESWAGELEPSGIHVSVLCPAFVQTRIHESGRNRQKKYQSKNSNPAETSLLTDLAKEKVEKGIEVSIVGKRVVEALHDGEFYIFTHPNYYSLAKQRAEMIDQAFNKSAQSPLLKHIVNQEIEMP